MIQIKTFSVSTQDEKKKENNINFSFSNKKKQKSASQSNLDKQKLENLFIEPSISTDEIFIGTSNKQEIKVLNIKDNIFITFLFINKETYKKELKLFFFNHKNGKIKEIKCQVLLLLENNNVGSSKTQYDFNLYFLKHFPQGS